MASYNGYPTVLIIMLVLCLVYSFICSRTIFGRGLYAIGGNRKAAMLSGVKDRLYFFLAYANMGLMSAVAALVYAARLNAATPKAGVNFELDAIGGLLRRRRVRHRRRRYDRRRAGRLLRHRSSSIMVCP